MTLILQSQLPFAPWMDPRTNRLPGILPLPAEEDWTCVDDAFAGQMAERDRLIAAHPERVCVVEDRARPAAGELYALVLAKLARRSGYTVGSDSVIRPDGVSVPLDPENPLATLGRLVQEDLCLLEQHGSEHVLTGAVLCFPAGWTLAQKIGRPLIAIHTPVQSYGPDIARRVQRLFDAIRPEQPLWRANSLLYDDPALHQPRLEGVPRPKPLAKAFARSEKQCLVRLPQTRAVVFAIHTYVVRMTDLALDVAQGLRDHHPDQG